MPHEIETRIATVRHRARRLLLLYALSWVVAVLVAAILVLGLADYWIRFRDPGLRVLSLLAVLAAGVWSAYRYLRPALARRLDDVAIAQKIEHRFPALGDRLSSAVEFLKSSPDDREVGSPALRALVIDQTTAAVADLDFADVLARRPTRRAVASAVAVIALASAAVLFDPGAARLALARLVNPLSAVDWPRQNDLAFRDPPERVARGQTFEVELVDAHGRPLPDEVRIHYRYETGDEAIDEVEPMHLLGGVMVARKENVSRPFSYRAEGGDDDTMSWHRLDVVEPPRVDSLKAMLYPPAYTGWKPEPAENNLHALRGTRVAFSGSATQPLSAVTLRQDSGTSIPCIVSTDGLHFELAADGPQPFVVDKSGQYWFELQNATGLVGGQESRWEIHAVADSPPSVTIEQPGANTYVTPSAHVHIRSVAKDDLGVRNITLHFESSPVVAPPGQNAATEPAGPNQAAAAEQAGETAISLFDGPILGADGEPLIAGSASLAGGLPGDTITTDYDWYLADLDLQPGSQVTFFVSASDAMPQTGRSPDRRLIVITPEELADRLAQRQEAILAELARVLKMEHDAQEQIARLSIQLREVGHLAKQDIDHAQSTELTQRHIARTLTDGSDGVPAQISDLLSDLASNEIDVGQTRQRLEKMLSTLERLQTEHLAPAEHRLTFAIKGAQADLSEATTGGRTDFRQSEAVAPALSEVDSHQQGVIRALEEMLGELGQWDSYRRFAHDLAQLARDEAELEQSTKELGPRLLGKQWRDLEPQQQADLKQLASRQGELGRQFDKLLSGMDQAGRKLDGDDPAAGARLADALNLAREQGTVGRMRSAGEALGHNQLGQAAAAETQVGRDLAEMLDMLTGRRERELERLVEKLQQAEGQLAALRAAHADLHKQSSQALDKPAGERNSKDKAQLDKLARQQRALKEEIDRLARRLEQLDAEAAGRTSRQAAEDVEREADDAVADDRAGADQESAAAERDLAKAQKQLAQRRREAEAELAREQLARLDQVLHGLEERQAKLLDETVRVDGHAAVAEARALAETQRELETETRQQADKLTKAEIFRLALGRSAGDMARAADQLDRGQTGQPAQSAEQAARAALARLIEALRPPANPAGGGEAGSGTGGSGGKSADVSQLAEIKLLKTMQEVLNARSEQLREAQPTPQSAAEMAELAAEQGRLAELTLQLAEELENEEEKADDEAPDPEPAPKEKEPLGRREDPV